MGKLSWLFPHGQLVSLCSRVQRAEIFIPFNHSLPVLEENIVYKESYNVFVKVSCQQNHTVSSSLADRNSFN